MSETKSLKLSDDTIALIRELVQLSILTGTNLVDHMRAVRLEVVDGATQPTEAYIKAYNAQIEELAQRAEDLQREMQETEATDDNN